MKTLFIRLLLSILLILGFISSVSAYATPKWRDFIVYTNYTTNKEELNIKIGIDVADRVKWVYKLEMPIGSKICKMDMEFSYGSYKVAGECDVDIAKEDLLARYNLDAEIKDEDGKKVFDGKIEFTVKGWYEEDYKWNKLDYTAVYDEKKEELNLELFLENIKRAPGQDYEIKIDFDNKNYTKKFSYSSSSEKLTADFTLDIDKEDIEDNYRIDFTVEDEDGKEVEDDRIEIDVENDSDDFDWKDLDFTSSYNEDSERLEIIFILEKIKKEPKESYKMYLELDREDYDERFRYYKDDKELRAKFTIKIKQEDIDDEYEIKMQVKDSDNKRVYRETEDMRVWEKRKEEKKEDAHDSSVSQDIVEDEVNAHLYYDEKNEKLIVTVFLPGINSYPDKESKAYLEIDGEKENKVMLYNVSKRILVSVFKINIDKEDVWIDSKQKYVEVKKNDIRE